MIHVYCGNGKGKTTAALGLAVRAAGAGMKVCFTQFMKGSPTSELTSLEYIPGIDVIRCDKNYGFFNQMTENDKSEITLCHNKILESAFCGKYDLIVLDELFAAYNYNLIDKEYAKEAVFNEKKAEVILTGRDPEEEFIQHADYVSRIEAVKHPYEKGVMARKGIEY